MKSPLPDYHIHTTLCNHAWGEMEEYVEHAISIGLGEIGFAEHMPVMPEPHLCMSYDDLPFYKKRVKELRERYHGRISIKLGAEIDIDPGRTDEIKKIIDTSDFDYIIGSVHYLDDWAFDQKQYKDRFEQGNINEIYERFFSTIIKAAKTGLYDITGHIDNLKRMGYRPSGDMTSYYERVASVLKSMDVAFEINTSGYDYKAGESYPSIPFLKVLNRYDVPVTVGSDAHKPEHVGRHYDKAVEALNEAGYTSIVHFEKRKRFPKSLLPAVSD